MATLISVFWTGTVEEDEKFENAFAKRMECLLGDWADCEGNADGAVQDIVEDWFESENWEDLFGDDDSAGLLIEIHNPPSIAGIYTVEIERIFKARAKKRESVAV